MKHSTQDSSSPNKSAGPSNPSSERLSFTLFLAAALHGLLIFGVAFEARVPNENAPSVTVTLATHHSAKAPDDADFLAQSNQQASGTEEQAKEITTDKLSPFSSQSINDTQIVQQRKQSITEPEKTKILSSSNGNTLIQDTQKPTEKSATKELGNDAQNIDLISAQIASLQAKLDRQRQDKAKRPRERVLTSVSTKTSHEAAYLASWAQKVESAGNKYFPDEAVRKKITGLNESSGHAILDNAAQQIIRQAAPFLPFPPEVRKDFDQLAIIRTWYFDIAGLTTSE